MKPVEELATRLKERPMVIIFGSFLHGSGRSFLADKLATELANQGVSVVRISSGEVFREIASSEGKTIEDFIRELRENEVKARKTDVKVDTTIKKRIIESLENGHVVIVDSNLAPFYAKGVKILVKVDPRTAGERVYRNRRGGDKEFKSIEDTVKELKTRTNNDVQRYKELSEDPNIPEEWRQVYKAAIDKWGDEGVFDIVVDNSRTVEDSMSTVLKGILEYIKGNAPTKNQTN